VAPARPELRYQPVSSLIRVNAGDKVLLRIVSLGYEQYSMTLAGPTMRVVAKDARFLKGSDGTANSYDSNIVEIGPGESVDAIFTAPAFDPRAPLFSDARGQYNKYLFYNRQYAHLNNAGGSGPGGQMTEIRVYRAGTLAAQTAPNT
jgi:hypothetical protein